MNSYDIQATDCEGTVLTTAATGKTFEHAGTVEAQLRALKTGTTPTGQRNRIFTFVVTGPLGTVTYTRTGGQVVEDLTGVALAAPKENLGACAFCHDDLQHGKVTGLRMEDDRRVRVCHDCRDDYAC